MTRKLAHGATTARPPASDFRRGLIAGLLLPLTSSLLIWGLLRITFPSPGFDVEVVSKGAAVTRCGGRSVVVADEGGGITQTCNGACDDLHVQASSGDNSYWVNVLDAQGACIACTGGIYVTSGFGDSGVTRFHVVGGRELDVQIAYGQSAAVSAAWRRSGPPIGPPAAAH